MTKHTPFIPIEEAIEHFRQGRDRHHRRRRGPRERGRPRASRPRRSRPESINFMAKHGRGLICLALTEERCDELDLPLMVEDNTSTFGTAFTVSIEARGKVTTGISAADRAATVLIAIDPATRPDDLLAARARLPAARQEGRRAEARRPDRGLRRPRHPGRPAAGGRDLRDHERRRHDGARAGSRQGSRSEHGLKMITVADLISYRLRHEKLVRKVASPRPADELRRLPRSTPTSSTSPATSTWRW